MVNQRGVLLELGEQNVISMPWLLFCSFSLVFVKGNELLKEFTLFSTEKSKSRNTEIMMLEDASFHHQLGKDKTQKAFE